MATTVPNALRRDGQPVRDELALQPPGGHRGRLPEVAVGVLVTVGFALAAVLWHLSAAQKVPVLALATDVGRGEVIEAEDLRVVNVASGDELALLSPSDSAEVVGRVAVADLGAGTLVGPSLVAAVPALQPGDGVVGLSLEGGQVPSDRLSPGDLVNVVTSGGDAGVTGQVVAERAEVVEVEDLGGQSRRYVALRTQEPSANEVAAAAERGHVRLVLVAP